MNIILCVALYLCCLCNLSIAAESLPFKKVVLWGHKLHSHTHSYIHAAFYKAFEYLGYETLWLDDADDVSAIDFASSLFITEGQVDGKIPLRQDCRYILHNCALEKYNPLIELKNCILLQVYTHDCLSAKARKIDDYIYVDQEDFCIYMPWATDLLPFEIDYVKELVSNRDFDKKSRTGFIGTIGDGIFGNINHIKAFQKACEENNIPFENKIQLSAEENLHYIHCSFMAPAIQGDWQLEKGYIPCRIFKNISYGAVGATNSKTVWELFNHTIVYNPDCYQLFHDLRERINTITLAEQFEIIDFVKQKHTYLNRIEHLLWFLNEIKPLY
jgi:hypothetical protein